MSSARFLGVLFDERMTGKVQLNYLIDKGKKVANIISSVSAVRWRSHPQLLLTLYRTVFRGAIEYGAQVYTLWRNKTIFIKKSMGYRMSTPINVMLAKTREIPLKQLFDPFNQVKNFPNS